MYKQVIVVLAVIAASVNAGIITLHGDVEHHAPRPYSFEYDVHDPHTGDVKKQHESSDGHGVKGYYMLHEADGTIREVHYTADKHSGFNAVVTKSGHAVHPQIQHPVVHHQPILHHQLVHHESYHSQH